MKTVLNRQKRIVILLLFAFAFSVHGVGQPVWNHTYIDNRRVMYFSSVLFDDSVYRIVGGTGDAYNLVYTRAMIGKIDNNANLTGYKTVKDSAIKNYGAFYNALIKDSRQELCYAGYSMDSQPRLLLLKQKPITDSIAVYEYYTPNTYAFQGYDILQYDNNTYFITGVRTTISPSNANVVLVKIDSSGNRIWEKYYGGSQYEEAKSLALISNGHLLIGAGTRDLNQTNEHANTWLIEVDTSGVVQRQWFDSNDSTYDAEGLTPTLDGGFVYGAQKKFIQTINSIWSVGTIVKMDSNFHKQWTFTDGSYNDLTGIYDLEELPDGSFIGCGNKPFFNGDSSMVSGWIVKLSAAGNVIWNKTYAGLTTAHSWNYLTDIDITPDGALIAVGQCKNLFQSPPQVGWFLKLDSNGCDIENCLVGIDETPTPRKDDLIQVYPNPFTSRLQITLTGEYSTDATFTITNTIGQTIYHQTESNLATGYTKMLDLSYLPAGLYFVAVNSGEQKQVVKVIKQ